MAKPEPAQEFTLDGAKLYVWVKGLESKLNNLLREVDVLKNDLLRKNSELRQETKILNEELLEIKHAQDKTTQKMELIIKELRRTAPAEELEVIKKYLEFWNPLHFVSQRDLERAVENKMIFHNNKKH